MSVSSGVVINDLATPTVVTLDRDVAQTVSPPRTVRTAFYGIPFLLTRGEGIALSVPLLSNSFLKIDSATGHALNVPDKVDESSVYSSVYHTSYMQDTIDFST